MGGSSGGFDPFSAIISAVGKIAGGAMSRGATLAGADSGQSAAAALLEQKKQEREEERRQEAEERRKKQEKLKEAQDLAKDKLTRLSGRESTIATGGQGLLGQAEVSQSQLKRKLGQ